MVRQQFSCCRKSRFSGYKSHFRFYSSLFTLSSETPINTGISRGEELLPLFTTLHPLFTFMASIETSSWLLLWLASGLYCDLRQTSIKTCDRPLLSLVWASVEFGSSLFWIRFKYEIKFTYGLVKVYLSLIPISCLPESSSKQLKIH